MYVGATKYSPAVRFDQHKAGIRAAGSVLKRGLEVLTGPVMHLQGLKRAQAEEIEEHSPRRSGTRASWCKAGTEWPSQGACFRKYGLTRPVCGSVC